MVLLVAVGACGSDPVDKPVDATSFIDVGWIEEQPCNEITQAGCNSTEKCSVRIISLDPLSGQIECIDVVDQPVGRGELCEFTDGVDDCGPGLWCHPADRDEPRCHELCPVQGPALCEPDETCEPISGELFGEYTGVCLASSGAMEMR